MGEPVWIVDDDRSIRWVLEKTLTAEGYEVTCFADADETMSRLAAGAALPAVLITDIRMPGSDGLHALKWVKRRYPALPVIVMTAFSDLDAAIGSYREGAFDYLPKPFDIRELKALVHSACKAGGIPHEAGLEDEQKVPDIIGSSAAMQEVFRAIGRLRDSSVTVLINGASGTGKERVARALHRHSIRADKAFVALNVAAIPRELIESELFGHQRGAFTGANSQRVGRFEQADGGTLFLDEIGDMPIEVQTRLLRVLQEGEFYRVGGTKSIKVDVRIIAATHQDLEQWVLDGRFRQDLLYRLNVVRIRLPELCQRREDVPLLAKYFLANAAREMDVDQKHLDDQAMALLMASSWPGNVRQLENICRRLTVMVPGGEIHPGDLPDELLEAQDRDLPGDVADDWQSALSAWAEAELAASRTELLSRALPGFERTLLKVALAETGGRRQEAARLLGWGRNTLTRKLKTLGIDPT